MKKRYSLMAVLLMATAIAKAQDTYMNDRLTATDDIDGTARYVGMGGAMGALGADLSVISSNPAGMALFRKSDIGMTFGAVVPGKANGWNSNHNRTYGERLPRASFDQMGFVWAANIDGPVLKYVTFAANYQKKANYNLGFYADNLNLNGLSQMDQVAELVTGDNYSYDNYDSYATDYNLAGFAQDYRYVVETKGGSGQYVNTYRGERSRYTRHQRGSLQAFDLNFAFNLNDRVYTGLTLGIDNIDFLSWSAYEEERAPQTGKYGNYTLYNDRQIEGKGFNVKWGLLARPVEGSPFRLGLAVETPTWYRIKNSSLFDLPNKENETWESYLESSVRTPWRARFSMGSTVDNILAWGVEYEYANMAKTKAGYPTYSYSDWDEDFRSLSQSTADMVMNQLTKETLKGQHTIRIGMEVKPTAALALRVGYNFISNRYRSNPRFDQYTLDSRAMDYMTSTDYMTLGATNIVTFGLGFRHKAFYADLAYKYRMQNGKFYAFDTGFTTAETQFSADNPELSGATISPVDVEFNRHQVMLSLGFKF